MRLMSRSSLILLLVFAMPMPCVAQSDEANIATQFKSRLRAITSGPTSADRMSSVVSLLEKMGIPFQVEAFTADDAKGKNLIVDLGDTSKDQILIGAHFDQVEVGQGAVDNGGSCAVLLELIEQFHQQPLKNHCLRFAFFDLEEAGLLGSAAYVKKIEADEVKPKHSMIIDIFGYGDSLWLMSEDKSCQLAQSFAGAGENMKLPVIVSGKSEYPPGDHLSFVTAKLPTLAVALIDKSEIPAIKSLLQGKRIAPPPILRTIHTPDDTLDKINANECARGLPIVEAAIRKLDKRQ